MNPVISKNNKLQLDTEQHATLLECSGVLPDMDIPQRVRLLNAIYREKFKGFHLDDFCCVSAGIIFPNKDIVQARAIIKATMGTFVEPEIKILPIQIDTTKSMDPSKDIPEEKPAQNPVKPEAKTLKPISKELTRQKRIDDNDKKKEAQMMTIIRGIRILKSEWGNLNDEQKAKRIANLNSLGSLFFKESAGEILGISDDELEKYIVKGRKYRSDEQFLDVQKSYHCERGNSRF